MYEDNRFQILGTGNQRAKERIKLHTGIFGRMYWVVSDLYFRFGTGETYCGDSEDDLLDSDIGHGSISYTARRVR